MRSVHGTAERARIMWTTEAQLACHRLWKTAVAATIVAALVACGPDTKTLPNGSQVAVVDSDCAARIKPLYDAERDMDSRLSVGLTKVAYGDHLGDVRVQYDKAVAAGKFPEGACFDTAVKLQDALNEYVEANNEWGDCISTAGCDTDSIKPQLQAHWSKATKLLDEVAVALPS